jgi:type I restriction enzyme, S subunit
MTASLARLDYPDPSPVVFARDVQFALNNFSRLCSRVEQVRHLRQTILNLALRGKLVPQDPNDEPAAYLLERLCLEAKVYATENAISLSETLPLRDEEIPFSAPAGWKWTRLAALFKVVTDGDHQPPPKSNDGVAFLTIGNVTSGRLDFSDCRYVPKSHYNLLPAYRVPKRGDILYTVVGATYGRPIFVDTDRPFCVQRHIAILKPMSGVHTPYLMHLLASPLVYNQASEAKTGAAQPTIALRPLRNFVVPVPPGPEQLRVDSKLEVLVGRCERLAVSLEAREDGLRRLIDALLKEALAPAKDIVRSLTTPISARG